MKPEEAKERIDKLREIINQARYAYHVLNKDLYPPEVLDSLKKELFDLEQKFPQFITPDSPTQRIAGKPLKEFPKIRHKVPMLSFNDAFSEDDLNDWQERNLKFLSPNVKLQYFCELKIDGLAIKLVYKKGLLEVASTRGDGYLGEDVTQNVKTIEAIPLSLLPIKQIVENLKNEDLLATIRYFENGYPEEIEVRGEVFMHLADFKELNEQRLKNGESLFANPRNAAAGSLRQLDSQITAQRKLDSFAYALITNLGQKTHEEEHKLLKCLGFKTNHNTKLCQNLKEVVEFRNYWEKNRDKLTYEIDGIVVTVNQNHIFKELGIVGKAPRGALAFKFSPKEGTTIVEDVIFQTGRTGIITPVAILKPVEVGGVIVSRASLHNEDEIKRLGLKIGDTVIVVRAGDVIPQIDRVITELRIGKEKNIIFPHQCPNCQTNLVKDGAYWRCPNKKCYALQKEKIIHFVSKSAFDILGLGEKIIEKLIDNNLISDPADLFKLKTGDLRKLSGFDVLLEKNILESINSRKKINLSKFIYALGIHHVGEENAKLLAKFFSQRERITKPDDLLKVTKNLKSFHYSSLPGFGEKVSQAVDDWFRSEENKNFLKKLTEVGIIFEEEKAEGKLKGEVFVFTGELEKYSREEAKKVVESMGAETTDTISKRVTILVIGKNPGSKLAKAKKLNIKIMSEEDFYNLIE